MPHLSLINRLIVSKISSSNLSTRFWTWKILARSLYRIRRFLSLVHLSNIRLYQRLSVSKLQRLSIHLRTLETILLRKQISHRLISNSQKWLIEMIRCLNPAQSVSLLEFSWQRLIARQIQFQECQNRPILWMCPGLRNVLRHTLLTSLAKLVCPLLLK